MSESDTSEVDISLSQQSPTQLPQVSQDIKPKRNQLDSLLPLKKILKNITKF